MKLSQFSIVLFRSTLLQLEAYSALVLAKRTKPRPRYLLLNLVSWRLIMMFSLGLKTTNNLITAENRFFYNLLHSFASMLVMFPLSCILLQYRPVRTTKRSFTCICLHSLALHRCKREEAYKFKE